MSDVYDIVGDLDDDDEDEDEFEGSIGEDYEMIGADDDDEDEDELLEALSVSGAGDSELIGARRSRRGRLAAKRRRNAMRRRIRRNILAKNAGLIRKVNLQSRRRNPLGFVPTSIPALSTLQVPSAPQNLFRPERLVIPSDIVFDIGLSDIKVGNVSQLVQSAELPGAIFSEVAIDTNVMWDTAEIGNQVSLSIRNKSGAAIEFTGALLGAIAKR